MLLDCLTVCLLLSFNFDQLTATLTAWKPALTRGAASNASQGAASTLAEDDEPSFDDEDG